MKTSLDVSCSRLGFFGDQNQRMPYVVSSLNLTFELRAFPAAQHLSNEERYAA